ncbi:MAG: hypothetical protein HY909_25875 [Deltaproteobacteria bacterium]|nr:hypothetical protein [Deltaproteobacteria bacterium]
MPVVARPMAPQAPWSLRLGGSWVASLGEGLDGWGLGASLARGPWAFGLQGRMLSGGDDEAHTRAVVVLAEALRRWTVGRWELGLGVHLGGAWYGRSESMEAQRVPLGGFADAETDGARALTVRAGGTGTVALRVWRSLALTSRVDAFGRAAWRRDLDQSAFGVELSAGLQWEVR